MNRFNRFSVAWVLLMSISGCASVSGPMPGVGHQSYDLHGSRVVPDAGAAVVSGGREEQMYQLLLGEVAVQRGDLATAIENMLAVALVTEEAALAERVTRICLYAKDWQRGLRAARRWIELDKRSREAQQIAAGILIELKNFTLALEHLRKVVVLADKQQDQAFVQIGRLLSVAGEQDDAMQVMSRLVEEYPRDSYAAYAQAMLAMHFKQYAVAKVSLNKALVLKPDLHVVTVAHARLLQETGEAEEALRVLQRGIKKYPDVSMLQLAYGRMLMSEKRYEKAIKQFESMLEESPYDDELLYSLALLTLDLGRLDEAQGYLQRLLQLGSRMEEAHYYTGRVHELRHRYQEAMIDYRRVEHGDYYVEAQLRIAYMLGKVGQVEQARRHMQGMRGMSSDAELLTRYYLVEGDVLREDHQYQAAFDVLSQALERMPHSQDVLYARSLVAEKLGRLDLAEQDLHAVLKSSPDNADALNALGFTLTNGTTRHAEAYQLITRAMQLKPNDAAITDSLGWVLYHLGRHAEAIECLRKALALQHDPEIAAHLGEVLWMNGDRASASSIWHKALQESPDHKVLLKTMQRFDPK